MRNGTLLSCFLYKLSAFLGILCFSVGFVRFVLFVFVTFFTLLFFFIAKKRKKKPFDFCLGRTSIEVQCWGVLAGQYIFIYFFFSCKPEVLQNLKTTKGFINGDHLSTAANFVFSL